MPDPAVTSDSPGHAAGALRSGPASATARLDAKLEHLDRLASLGALSATMAHEIKNALVATETFVQLLLERHPDAELAPIVHRELRRINEIVQQMLRLARPSAEQPTILNLHEALRSALVLVKPRMDEKAVQLDLHLQATRSTLLGSQSKLQQVMLNLLLNAVEASPQHGRIALTTENCVCEEVEMVRLRIKDHGIGIPPDHLDRLFTPFFTTKPGGTGLGLAITRHIVEEHQAAICLESQAGEGACFALTFPVQAPA